MIEPSKKEEYVTYIAKDNIFSKDNIVTNLYCDSIINKPSKAFWGSPKDCGFGWKEWCECNEMFLEKYDWQNPIHWTLQEGSKILRITWEDIKEQSLLLQYTKEDTVMKELMKNHHFTYLRPDLIIDFEKMLKDDIVAVELKEASIGHCFSNELEIMFNSWDCESIVVLDSSKIQVDNIIY